MQLWGEGMSGKVKINKGLQIMCRTAFLCAVALVLSVLENMIPVLPFSLPGMKPGLSNIAVMFSLEFCPLPCALSIVVVKGLFALVSRGAMAFLMSFCGSLCAALGMFFLIRSKAIKFGCFGIGIFGAFLHNMGQFAVSYLLISDAVIMYLPVLCLSSLLTGSLTAAVYFVVMPSLARVPVLCK